MPVAAVPRLSSMHTRTVYMSAGPLSGRTDVLQHAEQLGAEVRREQLVGLVQHQQRRAVRLQRSPVTVR